MTVHTSSSRCAYGPYITVDPSPTQSWQKVLPGGVALLMMTGLRNECTYVEASFFFQLFCALAVRQLHGISSAHAGIKGGWLGPNEMHNGG